MILIWKDMIVQKNGDLNICVEKLIREIETRISQYENSSTNPMSCGHYKTAVSVLKEIANVG